MLRVLGYGRSIYVTRSRRHQATLLAGALFQNLLDPRSPLVATESIETERLWRTQASEFRVSRQAASPTDAALRSDSPYFALTKPFQHTIFHFALLLLAFALLFGFAELLFYCGIANKANVF
jgi:hypothetical protein